jgi:hypothetical protein
MELNLASRFLVVDVDKGHAPTEVSSSRQPLHSERFQNPLTVHSNCDVQLATEQLLTGRAGGVQKLAKAQAKIDQSLSVVNQQKLCSWSIQYLPWMRRDFRMTGCVIQPSDPGSGGLVDDDLISE